MQLYKGPVVYKGPVKYCSPVCHEILMEGIPQVIHHGNSGRFTLDSTQLGVSIATDSHERNTLNIRTAYLKVVSCDAMRLQKKEAVINDLGRNLEPNQHEAQYCLEKGSTCVKWCAVRCIIYGEYPLSVVILKLRYLRESVTHITHSAS
jgi:hypothetical protein